MNILDTESLKSKARRLISVGKYKSALFILTIVLLSISSPQVCRAGEWSWYVSTTPSYSHTQTPGNQTIGSNNFYISARPFFSIANDELFFSECEASNDYNNYDYYFGGQTSDEAVTSVTHGNATLYWLPSTPNPANDPPPSSVTVWEYGNARAVVQNSQYSKVLLPMPGSPRVSADDGLKDPCITYAPSEVGNLPGQYWGDEASSWGYHLHTYAVSIQSGTLTSANCPGVPPGQSYNYSGLVQLLAITQTGAASIRQSYGYSEAVCEANIEIDSRSINIVSPRTYWKQTLAKGGRTLTDHDGDPQWIAAPNVPSGGAMWGDVGIPDAIEPLNTSGAGYGIVQLGSPNYLSVTYMGQALGWTTSGMNYNWSDSISGASAKGTYGVWHSGFGAFSAKYVGAEISASGAVCLNQADPGNPARIILRVRDNFGTTGTANFYMRIHRGWEVLPSNRKSPGDGDLYEPATITDYFPKGTQHFCGYKGSLTCQYETPNAGYGDISTGYALHMIGNLATLLKLGEWVAVAFAAAGDTLENFFVEKISTFTIQWTDFWGVTHLYAKDNIPSSTYVNKNGKVVSFDPGMDPADYLMYAHFEAQYQPTWHRGDSYGSGGFTGETKFHTDIWTGSGLMWAEFKWNPAIKKKF